MSNYLIEEITSLKNRIEALENYIEKAPSFGFVSMFSPDILEQSKNLSRLARLKTKKDSFRIRYDNSIFRNIITTIEKEQNRCQIIIK